MDKTRPPRGEPLAVTHPPPSWFRAALGRLEPRGCRRAALVLPSQPGGPRRAFRLSDRDDATDRWASLCLSGTGGETATSERWGGRLF